MEQLLPLYHPDIVIYGFCMNDLEGNVLPYNYGQGKPVFKFTGSGELVMLPPKLNERINPFYLGIRTLIQFSALYKFFQPNIIYLRNKIGMFKETDLAPGEDDWYHKPEALAQVDWQIFTALLKKMNQYCLSYKADFIFYSHPALAEVWDPYINKIIKCLSVINLTFCK